MARSFCFLFGLTIALFCTMPLAKAYELPVSQINTPLILTNQAPPKPKPPPHADIMEGYKAIVIQMNDSLTCFTMQNPPSLSREEFDRLTELFEQKSLIGGILNKKIKSAVKSTTGSDMPVILVSAENKDNIPYPPNITPEDSLFLQVNFTLSEEKTQNGSIIIGSLQPMIYRLVDWKGEQKYFYLHDFLQYEKPQNFILDASQKELGARNALQDIANGFAIFLAQHRDYAKIKNVKEPTF